MACLWRHSPRSEPPCHPQLYPSKPSEDSPKVHPVVGSGRTCAHERVDVPTAYLGLSHNNLVLHAQETSPPPLISRICIPFDSTWNGSPQACDNPATPDMRPLVLAESFPTYRTWCRPSSMGLGVCTRLDVGDAPACTKTFDSRTVLVPSAPPTLTLFGNSSFLSCTFLQQHTFHDHVDTISAGTSSFHPPGPRWTSVLSRPVCRVTSLAEDVHVTWYLEYVRRRPNVLL